MTRYHDYPDTAKTYRPKTIAITPGLWTRIECSAEQRAYLYWTDAPSGRLLVAPSQEAIRNIVNPILQNNFILLPLSIGESVPCNFGDSNENLTYFSCDGTAGHTYTAKIFLIENDEHRDRKSDVCPSPFKAIHVSSQVPASDVPGELWPLNSLRNSAIIFNAGPNTVYLMGTIPGVFGAPILDQEKLYISALDGCQAQLNVGCNLGENGTLYVSEFFIDLEI
jgi:hypothetical protein